MKPAKLRPIEKEYLRQVFNRLPDQKLPLVAGDSLFYAGVALGCLALAGIFHLVVWWVQS